MNPRGSHVRIESLCHRYSLRGPLVLDDVNLTLDPGSRVALIGRSGCGKSTLLQLMAGLTLPHRGRIHIDGTLVKQPSPRWNVMFQQPSLYPWMTAEKNAALGMLIAGDAGRAACRVLELLELVGMSAFAKSNVRHLSGGQQQRIALARSLATNPELLMLDEPFAALDEVTRAAMQRDVTGICKELGITQVIVTHDIDEAFLMADRIIVLSSAPGRVVADIANDDASGQVHKRRVRSLLSIDDSPIASKIDRREQRLENQSLSAKAELSPMVALLSEPKPRLAHVR